MTRRTLLSVAVLLISTAACSSESSGGTPGAGTATSSEAGVSTTSGATSSEPATTAAGATSTPPTSAAATTSTPAPTTLAPSTTTACRTMTDPAGGVRLGDCGPAVEQIQSYLISKGFSIAMDGRFGPATDAAVREFQTGSGLEVDGIVGPMTWMALQSDDIPVGEA